MLFYLVVLRCFVLVLAFRFCILTFCLYFAGYVCFGVVLRLVLLLVVVCYLVRFCGLFLFLLLVGFALWLWFNSVAILLFCGEFVVICSADFVLFFAFWLAF